MPKLFEFGRAIFAVAMIGMGVQCILRGNVVPQLEPVVGVTSLPVIGWFTGIVLIAAAVASMVRRTAISGATVLAAVVLLWVVLLHAPALAAAPKNGSEWTGASETFALGGVALVLFGLTRLSLAWRRIPDALTARCVTIGRILVGVSMLGFGTLHFLYIPYVAVVIPSWIPAHDGFAYATGVAHIAAGLSILTGVLARMAALCAAAMFGSWVLILHVPRALAHVHEANEWMSMLIALAMCGGSLLIAATLSNISRGAALANDADASHTRTTAAA